MIYYVRYIFSQWNMFLCKRNILHDKWKHHYSNIFFLQLKMLSFIN